MGARKEATMDRREAEAFTLSRQAGELIKKFDGSSMALIISQPDLSAVDCASFFYEKLAERSKAIGIAVAWERTTVDGRNGDELMQRLWDVTRMLKGHSRIMLDEVRSVLASHAYMWSRHGWPVPQREVVGYHNIPGPKNGQEIRINNFGTLERPNWCYTAYENDTHVCFNRHFANPEQAYVSAYECLESPDRKPHLRLFQWFKGHHAYTVDGLDDQIECVVFERTPGEWFMDVAIRGLPRFWLGPWSTHEHALIV